MVKKVAGLARVLAILLAIVAAFVALGALDTALVLFVLGLIAGPCYEEDNVVRLFLVILVLPVVAAGLGTIPQIGGQLGAIATNIQLAASGAATTVIVIRLYGFVKGDLAGLGAK
jgi:tellurite resistance protein TehA-like permease